MRECSQCKQNLPKSAYYTYKRGQKTYYYRRTCKECDNEQVKSRYKNMSPEERTRYNKTANRRVRKRRKQVIDKYGGKCVCCGEKEYVFLAIDHVNGGGAADRKSMGTSQFITWIIKNNYPSSLRILCHNCNQATRYGKVCPHQK